MTPIQLKRSIAAAKSKDGKGEMDEEMFGQESVESRLLSTISRDSLVKIVKSEGVMTQVFNLWSESGTEYGCFKNGGTCWER